MRVAEQGTPENCTKVSMLTARAPRNVVEGDKFHRMAQGRYTSTVKLKDNRITCNEDSIPWRIERDGGAELLHDMKGQITATEPKRIETNRCVNVNVVDCWEHLIDHLMAPLQASRSISAQLDVAAQSKPACRATVSGTYVDRRHGSVGAGLRRPLA